MTTLSIVAGLIPVAIGMGAGSEQRASIAVTIIGGQTLCLLLTLLIVPVAYSYLAELEVLPVRDLFRRFSGRPQDRSPTHPRIDGHSQHLQCHQVDAEPNQSAIIITVLDYGTGMAGGQETGRLMLVVLLPRVLVSLVH